MTDTVAQPNRVRATGARNLVASLNPAGDRIHSTRSFYVLFHTHLTYASRNTLDSTRTISLRAQNAARFRALKDILQTQAVSQRATAGGDCERTNRRNIFFIGVGMDSRPDSRIENESSIPTCLVAPKRHGEADCTFYSSYNIP